MPGPATPTTDPRRPTPGPTLTPTSAEAGDVATDSEAGDVATDSEAGTDVGRDAVVDRDPDTDTDSDIGASAGAGSGVRCQGGSSGSPAWFPADEPGPPPPPTSHAGSGDESVHQPLDLAASARGDEWCLAEEPGPDDEADRDTPHPMIGGPFDHLDALSTRDILNAIEREAWRHPRPPDASATVPRQGTRLPTTTDGEDADRAEAFSRRALAGTLAAIKQAAHRTGLGGTGTRRRPRTELYVHLTDQTLHTGDGIIRVEEHGILLAGQLRELLGHDQVVVKPVIDLKDKIHVNAYEIPLGIRERVKLTHPVEQFPYGTTETTMHTDLDHIVAYDPTGPPEQTSTTNLSPASRFHHRLKTHARWHAETLDDGALLWTSPNGYQYRVDHTGTHPITTTTNEPTNQPDNEPNNEPDEEPDDQ